MIEDQHAPQLAARLRSQSDALLDLLTAIMCADPRKRPSAEDALQHAWLDDFEELRDLEQARAAELPPAQQPCRAQDQSRMTRAQMARLAAVDGSLPRVVSVASMRGRCAGALRPTNARPPDRGRMRSCGGGAHARVP